MKIALASWIKRNTASTALIACLGLGLVACANDLPELTMDSVSVYTDIDANNNSATAVDLVVIYDQDLVKTFSQMSASQYFTSMSQLLLDNPTLLDIWHWELVPGQIVQAFSPKQNSPKAFGAYVYANYLTDGDHRIKVSPNGIVKILLQKSDLVNLSTYDVREATPGTTMANAVKKTSGDGSTSTSSQVNIGTTTDSSDLSQPCTLSDLFTSSDTCSSTDSSGSTQQPCDSTAQQPCATTQPSGTTQQPSGATQPYGTTQQPSGTIQQPCGSTQPSPTTQQPCGSTQPSPTTQQPCGSTQPSPTTQQPCATTQPSGATQPYSITQPSMSQSNSTTQQSSVSTEPVVKYQGQQVLNQPIPIAQQPLTPPSTTGNNAPMGNSSPASMVKNGKTDF